MAPIKIKFVFRDYMREYMKKRRLNRRKKLIDLLGGKCSKCGSRNNLEFDHVNRKKKEFEIADAIDGPEAKLITESKKCVLLCRKCHLKKTRDNWEYNEGGPSRHGTISRYKKYKCRCADCKMAMRLYRIDSLKKKSKKSNKRD